MRIFSHARGGLLCQKCLFQDKNAETILPGRHRDHALYGEIFLGELPAFDDARKSPPSAGWFS